MGTRHVGLQQAVDFLDLGAVGQRLEGKYRLCDTGIDSQAQDR